MFAMLNSLHIPCREKAGNSKDKVIEKGKTKPDQQPVKFQIADDDDEDKTEMDTLMRPPQILIESPSFIKGDEPTHV